MAIALLQKETVLSLNLCSAFWKQLVQQDLDASDLAAFDEMVCQSLCALGSRPLELWLITRPPRTHRVSALSQTPAGSTPVLAVSLLVSLINETEIAISRARSSPRRGSCRLPSRRSPRRSRVETKRPSHVSWRAHIIGEYSAGSRRVHIKR